MKRVISFSLWGDRPKYLAGACRNAELCPRFYPGWIARFHVGPDVPAEVTTHLRACGAEVVLKRPTNSWQGYFWRFEAAADPEVGIAVFRDCDSRIGARETAAVSAWLESPAKYHIMRDHPWHVTPMLAGMWGVRGNLPPESIAPPAVLCTGTAYGADQQFLLEHLYPEARYNACVHDEFFGGRPFPTARQGLEFVGQVYAEDESTPADDQFRLAAALRSDPFLRLTRRLLGRWILHKGRIWRLHGRLEDINLRRHAARVGASA